MRIGIIGTLMISLTMTPAWATQVGNLRFISIPIKDKAILKRIDRRTDIHVFFKKKDIIHPKYHAYTVESGATDVSDQHNKIVAIQFATYGIVYEANHGYFHEVVKCAFVDIQNGHFLFESDAQMCDGEWKQPKLWQDGSGRYLDFDKLSN